jgi:hypothetical protein
MISSESDNCGRFATPFVLGTTFRGTLVEVLERTLGHAGAAVWSLRRPKRSAEVDLHAAAASEMLQSVMENPGPLSELSKVPEYTFVG